MKSPDPSARHYTKKKKKKKKEVKPDRSISDNKLTALASRSLFAQPPRHGAGSRIAPMTVKERMVAKNKMEVIEKRVESIHYGSVNCKTTKVA